MPGTARTLAEYIAAVAAGTPAPGGGSVAGVSAALAAALGSMVADLTANRERDAAIAAKLRAAIDQLTGLRERMMTAAAADEAAYGAYRAASSLPRQTDDEKARRREAMQDALIAATEAPLEVARGAVAIAKLLGAVARIGNPRLAADIALGAMLAETALRGSLLNIRSNAAMLDDRALATRVLDEAGRLEREGREAVAAARRASESASASTEPV